MPAPIEINAYTDGALKQPQDQYWGLLGFGIWWKGRDLDKNAPTVQETTYTDGHDIDAKNLSVRLWGHLVGHRGGSTRAEIAAILVALNAGCFTTVIH